MSKQHRSGVGNEFGLGTTLIGHIRQRIIPSNLMVKQINKAKIIMLRKGFNTIVLTKKEIQWDKSNLAHSTNFRFEDIYWMLPWVTSNTVVGHMWPMGC